MKKCLVVLSILLFITGCKSTPFDGNVVIDWVDFIKWNGIEYNGIHTAVIAGESDIGEKIGEIEFMVADNVTNSNYKIKNGDAAFHEKGTELYRVKGMYDMIAVKSTSAINGFQVYYPTEKTKYSWHSQDMPLEKVNRIEIYEAYTSEGTKRISEVSNLEEVKSFLTLLESSEVDSTFQPNTEKGDPTYYEMVFYTGEPIAYKYAMQYDGESYYWHPWDTSILPTEMKGYLTKPN
ncbi:MAG: hypothetical protein ACQEXB_21600 [Bacillota bacterium]